MALSCVVRYQELNAVNAFCDLDIKGGALGWLDPSGPGPLLITGHSPRGDTLKPDDWRS